MYVCILWKYTCNKYYSLQMGASMQIYGHMFLVSILQPCKLLIFTPFFTATEPPPFNLVWLYVVKCASKFLLWFKKNKIHIGRKYVGCQVERGTSYWDIVIIYVNLEFVSFLYSPIVTSRELDCGFSLSICSRTDNSNDCLNWAETGKQSGV